MTCWRRRRAFGIDRVALASTALASTALASAALASATVRLQVLRLEKSAAAVRVARGGARRPRACSRAWRVTVRLFPPGRYIWFKEFIDHRDPHLIYPRKAHPAARNSCQKQPTLSCQKQLKHTRLDGVKNSIIMILIREEEISLADARSRRQRRAAALAPLAAPAHRATLPSRSRPHTS